MAMCDGCNLDMAKAEGCTAYRTNSHGRNIVRIHYYPMTGNARCHDCNCMPGYLHHIGCDMERCPVCSGQLMCCPE